MTKAPKIIVAAQYYAPDESTTATFTTEISRSLAEIAPVLVLSGSEPCSPSREPAGNPTVHLIKNAAAPKAALGKRVRLELIFALRMFVAVLKRAKRGDVVVTVTSPFVLPYAVVAASYLKGARSVLLLYDLYPDVLILSGIIRANGLTSRVLHFANSVMYRALDAVVTIGRDTERLLSRYAGATKRKLSFIPNWATLPVGHRPFDGNRFRDASDTFVVGLSGNLGFTHDPHVVFEAAKQLEDQPGIHFLLSGWGIGFNQLKQLQRDARLRNVTIVDRVPAEQLEEFLSAANVWLIPYKPNVAGVSIPSRFYNILAVGRPIILISEPDSEAAMTIAEYDLGWVVAPATSMLAKTILEAQIDGQAAAKGKRAAVIANRFARETALEKYRAVFQHFLLEVT